MTERIQKVLSQQGYCSRRAAEKLISEGRVKVNGRTASLGESIDISTDRLTVDNVPILIQKRPEKLYYMINKPRGYVTTLHDRHAKKEVAALIEDLPVRLFPVGRLDKDSEGLLFLTNDGEFANMITHPSRGVTKSYRVSVKPAMDETQLSKLSVGVELDGVPIMPVAITITGEERNKTVFEITLSEGRNREIRRICEAVGLTVTRLKRTAIGPIRLGTLATGRYRELTKAELKAVYSACSQPQGR
ncbi:MAG: rRNA pseudouridine synthase [Oscillospiraceae bacterium]|nr:rRNA pseudouridine synthase [Oscillospiraceae bacterium]